MAESGKKFSEMTEVTLDTSGHFLVRDSDDGVFKKIPISDVDEIRESLAIQLIRIHDPDLSFQGFVNTDTSTPGTYTSGHCWIAEEAGSIFGKTVTAGQLIRDTGSKYIVEKIKTRHDSLRRNVQMPGAFKEVTAYTDGVGGDTFAIGRTTTGPSTFYYQGRYNRTYCVWGSDNSNDNKGYMFWYDHDTGIISDNYQVTEPISGASDEAHAHPAFIISKDGYIISACQELQDATTHNSEINIYISANPEDPDSITPSSPDTTIGTGGSNDSYAYQQFAVLPNNRILLSLRQGQAGANHYRRALFYSDDNGSNWSEINPSYSNGDWIVFPDVAAGDSDGWWLYGNFIQGTYDDYCAFLLYPRDHSYNSADYSQPEYNRIFPNSYLLITKDGETWGNIQWFLDLDGSWSVDSTSNIISKSDLDDNCLVTGEGKDIGEQEYGTCYDNLGGGFDAHGRYYMVYQKRPLQDNFVPDDCTYYLTYFDEDDNAWKTVDISSTLPFYPYFDGGGSYVICRDRDGRKALELITQALEGGSSDYGHLSVRRLITVDLGSTWTEIEELTLNDDTSYRRFVANPNHLESNRLVLVDNDTSGDSSNLKIWINENEKSDVDAKILKNQTIASRVEEKNFVYFDGTDWDLTDSDTQSSTEGLIGMYIGRNQVLVKGIINVPLSDGSNWDNASQSLSAGDTYYVSGTAGEITNSKPGSGYARIVGYAIDDRNLIFSPSDYTESI